MKCRALVTILFFGTVLSSCSRDSSSSESDTQSKGIPGTECSEKSKSGCTGVCCGDEPVPFCATWEKDGGKCFAPVEPSNRKEDAGSLMLKLEGSYSPSSLPSQ
jgi:hypothetical protein